MNWKPWEFDDCDWEIIIQTLRLLKENYEEKHGATGSARLERIKLKLQNQLHEQ